MASAPIARSESTRGKRVRGGMGWRYCPAMWRRLQSFRARLAALALTGAVLRAFYTFVLTPHQLGFGDWGWFNGVANGIARGDWYSNPFLVGQQVASASHPPLYPLVLSLGSLLGGTGYQAHRAFGVLLGAAGIVLMGLLGRRIGGPRVGLVAAALTTVYPVFVAADGALLAETLFTPVLAGTLLVAYRVRDEGSARWAAALGALVALCALTRSESLLLMPLLALPAVWRPRPGRCAAARAALVAFVVVMAPWTIRNVHAFHRPGARVHPGRRAAGRGQLPHHLLRPRAGRLELRLPVQGAVGERGGAERRSGAARGATTPATTRAGCRWWCWCGC